VRPPLPHALDTGDDFALKLRVRGRNLLPAWLQCKRRLQLKNLSVRDDDSLSHRRSA